LRAPYTSKGIKSKRTLLALLVALSIITFLDRLCIAVAGPRVQQDLGISPEQWGWVLGSFVLSYGLFEIPTGAMGDRFGYRGVLTRIVLWWSVFTALTGAVTGFVPLVITRFLFGAGEAGAFPNMAGVVSRWFAASERAVAQGFVLAASRAGGALAPLLVVPIQVEFGWRASFFVFGAVGAVWCAIWWRWYRDPAESGSVASSRGTNHSAPWAILFRSTQLWIIVAMYGCYCWGVWFYFSWFHTWLVKARGFTEAEMSIFASLPFVLGAAANLAGGYVSEASVRRFGLRRGRVIVGSSCLTAGACLLVATALTKDRNAAVVLLTLGFGAMDLMLPSAWAVCLDISGPHAGAVSGAMNTAGQFGGFLCTVMFGYIVKFFNDYDLPLFAIAAMVALAAILFTRIDASRPLIAEPEMEHVAKTV
jgi:MFS transporter, ACS family, glucarate transporter